MNDRVDAGVKGQDRVHIPKMAIINAYSTVYLDTYVHSMNPQPITTNSLHSLPHPEPVTLLKAHHAVTSTQTHTQQCL